MRSHLRAGSDERGLKRKVGFVRIAILSTKASEGPEFRPSLPIFCGTAEIKVGSKRSPAKSKKGVPQRSFEKIHSKTESPF